MFVIKNKRFTLVVRICFLVDKVIFMLNKRLFFIPLFLAYIIFFFFFFWIGVGLYVSLLTLSFFVLFTPITSFFALINTLICDQATLRRRMLYTIILWGLLLFLNYVTFIFLPVLYTKTPLTMLLYHLMLVPRSGILWIGLTACSLGYDYAITYVPSSWQRLILCLIGSALWSMAFYFFLRSVHFAQFIASLNLNALNY